MHDAFSFFLSFFGDGRKKEGRKIWSGKTKQNKTKKPPWTRMCESCQGEQRHADKTSQECWGPSSETHTVYVVLTTNQKYVPIWNVVESTAVLKSLGTSETNDPSQTVLTGSVLEPGKSCDWCRITAAPSFSTSIIAQWKSCGAVGLSYNIVYVTRWCKALPAKLHCWIMIFTNSKRA